MPRYGVELIAKVEYRRYIVLDLPEGTPLGHDLPWEEISDAVDRIGHGWQTHDDPMYEYWSECDPMMDEPIVTIERRDCDIVPFHSNGTDFIVADTLWPDPTPKATDSDTTL